MIENPAPYFVEWSASHSHRSALEPISFSSRKLRFHALAVLLGTLVTLRADVPLAITDAVAESGDYQLIYQAAVPANNEWQGKSVPYSVDNSATALAFDRIAYVMELDGEWVWASFNTFTTDLAEIGVPTYDLHPAPVQRYVRSLNVFSNITDATRVATGLAIADANLEFWSGDIGTPNLSRIPSASGSLYDTGDAMKAGGYGSMQVHNSAANQVVFALNNWGHRNRNAPIDIGIGSQAIDQPDWYGSGSATLHTIRNLYILVRPGVPSDLTVEAPMVKRAVPSLQLDQVYVEFDQEMGPTAADPSNYSIDGVTIDSATLAPDSRGTYLAVSFLQAASDYTLVVSSAVAEKEPGTQTIPDATEVTFATFTVPEIFAGIPELPLYSLAYQLQIPTFAFFENDGVPYVVEEPLFHSPEFARVGYALVLQTGDSVEWVFASFDAHTTDFSEIGLPTTNVGTWQQKVQSLNVWTNIPDRDRITPGMGFDGGNIEFWAAASGDRSSPPIPNASDDLFDFGDKIRPIGGWGSFQVHNHGLSEVVFAYNGWAGTNRTSGLGIGTNLSGTNPDWTFEEGAADYVLQDLYVFVGPELPPFEITDISTNPTGDKALVTWNSLPGLIYSVEFSEDFVNWREITDDKISEGLTSTFEVDMDGRELFYRVRISR